MNKKGFTLIELLAVIVLLAIIALIATPIVIGMIENTKKSASEQSAYGYVEAVEKRIALSDVDDEKYPSVFEKNITYSIGEASLNSVSVKGTKPISGTVSVGSNRAVESATLCINGYRIIYSDNKAYASGKCSTKIYTEGLLNGTDPVLGINMIPVTISNDGTVKYADVYEKWYSYEDKNWANVVMLSGGKYNVGDTIPESSIESYFVWIPRYKYKIFDLGNYTNILTGKPGSSNSKTIEIEFESKDKTPSTGITLNSWITHTAFRTLDTNGIWVGKYETGYKGATSTVAAQVTSADASKIIIKPDTYSWRNNTIYNMFVSSLNYSSNNGSHMMKNTEWGAVTYLSNSKYGINKEININNNSSYKTGYSATESAVQSTNPGVNGTTSSVTLGYNTSTGYKASTTGNISGIYDMSGGAWEYVAAYVSGRLGTSGFTTSGSTNISQYNSKYFDIYPADSTISSYNKRILGDATGELGPFYNYADSDGYNRYHNSWYSDLSNFVDSTSSWFIRGSGYDNGNLAGQYYFYALGGVSYLSLGHRIVLSK